MSSRGQDSEDESHGGSQVTNIHKKRKKLNKSNQIKSNEANESINDNVMFDVPRDDQNSRISLTPSEYEMTSSLQTEVNKQLHVTGEMEIDGQKNKQSEIDETEVEELKNEQMSYSVRNLKDSFDEEEWHYGQILEALKNEELLCKLITHKLYTIPTRHEMPKAIQFKFKHQDKNFFRTFTRNTKIMPAHQIEFKTMNDKAIQNYKGKHSIIVTNREIKDQINNKVRQKLAIQHITNSRFKKNPQEITKVLNYCIGFMKLSEGLQGDIVWKSVNKAIQNTLLPFPEKSEDIPEDVREVFFFEIPIKNRANLRSILAALRKVYTFAQLPDEYFTELEPLPDNPWDIRKEVKDLFPIIDRKDLRKVYGYKQQLAEYYKWEGDLPESYFRLPEKKILLPLTPQELNHKYRAMFPIDLTRSNKSIKEISDMLRETYFFKFIPNDFFIQKPRLSRDVKRINTQSKYNFPIEDKKEAIRFIEEILAGYNFTIPLLSDIMTINPIEKPELPPLYYFHQIPDTWVEIQKKSKPIRRSRRELKGNEDRYARQP
ncbi:hypothetical protein C2G38_2197707 [Gigaspora rosea]|uniref:Uncharacterized protein n=1 Tax=Gigaspora rosea TaxID=44941 RepID=A0A397UXN2_9GLOM|nr:hypothetical protein C2G38_2197707 [Gigaspora rosea]